MSEWKLVPVEQRFLCWYRQEKDMIASEADLWDAWQAAYRTALEDAAKLADDMDYWPDKPLARAIRGLRTE